MRTTRRFAGWPRLRQPRAWTGRGPWSYTTATACSWRAPFAPCLNGAVLTETGVSFLLVGDTQRNVVRIIEFVRYKGAPVGYRDPVIRQLRNGDG